MIISCRHVMLNGLVSQKDLVIRLRSFMHFLTFLQGHVYVCRTHLLTKAPSLSYSPSLHFLSYCLG